MCCHQKRRILDIRYATACRAHGFRRPAALTIALSHARLGQKVSERSIAYYALEGVAWERFAQIDKALQPASGEHASPLDAAAQKISQLGFETTLRFNDGIVEISYETWDEENNIGISAILAYTPDDAHSLRPIQWKQIQ